MPTNIKEAEDLVKTYKSITLLQLEKLQTKLKLKNMHMLLNYLTGFGDAHKCTLCIAVGTKKRLSVSVRNCDDCLYYSSNAEHHHCVSQDTYRAIVKSETPLELYNALQDRIKFIEARISPALSTRTETNKGA